MARTPASSLLALLVLSGLLPVSGATLLDYPFHSAEGTTTVNVGTLGAAANGSHFGTIDYSSDTPGGTGESIRLLGVVGGIQVPDAWDYGGALTVEAWIKPASIEQQSILWDDYGNPGVVFGVRPDLITPSTKVLQFSLSTASNPGPGLSILDGEIALDAWQHVAGVYDGTTMSIYIDGILAGTLANSGAIQDNGGTPAGLGAENLSLTLNFDGWIDDFRIHDTALSPAQLAGGAFGPLPEGDSLGAGFLLACLAAAWRFGRAGQRLEIPEGRVAALRSEHRQAD